MTDIAYNLISNAEIADRLASLAQLLSAQKENPYKIKAYQRAAAKIRALPESIQELVREDVDLTTYAGIGEAISGAIQEIVRTGTLGKLEKVKSEVLRIRKPERLSAPRSEASSSCLQKARHLFDRCTA